MQFLGTIAPNNKLASQLFCWRPLLWKILDPSLDKSCFTSRTKRSRDELSQLIWEGRYKFVTTTSPKLLDPQLMIRILSVRLAD